LAGLRNATGSADFDNEVPFDLTYSGGYELTYTVSSGETDNGDDVIITVYDRVGNSITRTLNCVLDNAAPSIVLADTAVTETSDFTYYPQDGTQILWYSNKMSGDINIEITITSDDGSDSGVQAVEFPALFNEVIPINDTTVGFFQIYTISTDSNDNGTFIFTSFDNVGNSATVTLDIIRDNQVPDQSSISAIIESSVYIHRNPTYSRLWYSDLMGSTSVPVNIVLTGIDPGLTAAGLATITFPTIGDESPGNITSGTSSYSVIYNLTDSDSTTGVLSFIVYDRVGNQYQIPLEVINDITIPSIQFNDVENPIYDPNANELDDIGNWYDQAELTGGYSIISQPSDPLSGTRQGSGVYTVFLDWDSTNNPDDQPSFDIGADGDHNVIGLTDDADANITITLIVVDNVNNSFQRSITIRFDNTDPVCPDLTTLHQNGPIISLVGSATDTRSGIQNITLTDLSASQHFPNLITSGFDSWILENSSSLDVDIVPGQNITINVAVFDNVNNKYSYNSTITFHTLKFLVFTSNIPKRVEIDNPNPLKWNITIGFEFDGTLIDSNDKIIDRFLNQSTLLTQFSAWINGTSLPIKDGSLIWLPGPQFQFTVILPDSSSSLDVLKHLPLGETLSKDIRVEWNITTAFIDVLINHTKSKVVSYHDLEILYLNDDISITETDNPDIMNIVLHLRKDHQALDTWSGVLEFTLNGGTAIIEGAISPEGVGTGNWSIPIRLPSGLLPGLKDISFLWRYDLGDYYYVTEFNTSTDVVNYHDINITANIPSQLFEIDDDFNFTVYFTITEDYGNGSGPIPILGLQSTNLTAFRILNNDLFNQTWNFTDLGGLGDYAFNFTLYEANTSESWLGSRSVFFKIISSTGLFEWGQAIILGHDLQMTILSIETLTGIQIFDPDERTSFVMEIKVRDNNGTGPINVVGLDASNFIQIFMQNVDQENQNTTIISSEDWQELATPGEYRITFVLEALAASQLSLGDIRVELSINDTNGHRIVQSIIELVSRDTVDLLGLEWISTPFGTFFFNDVTARMDYTFRVTVGQKLSVCFRIYKLEEPPGSISDANVTVFWNTPWNITNPEQSHPTSRYITLNLTSNIVYRQKFVAYVENNLEKQLQLQPWSFFVEWDEIRADPIAIDDSTDDDEASVLNIDGNYTLTYTAKFDRSNINVKGSQFEIGINLYQFDGIDWILYDGNLTEQLGGTNTLDHDLINGLTTILHQDGNGSRIFFFEKEGIIVGKMYIADVENSFLLADGQIKLILQFYDIFKVNINFRTINETGDDVTYRYYPSYYTGSGPVYSSVNETSQTVFQDTLIWTKFNVRMWVDDDRIPQLTPGTVYLEAYYAHNASWILDDEVYIYIVDTSLELTQPIARNEWEYNHIITFSNLISGWDASNGWKAKYNISSFEDSRYGISGFTDKFTQESDVFVEIIWDQIVFEFSLPEPWGENLRFNVNTSAYIQVVAYYLYDKQPFIGTFFTRHGYNPPLLTSISLGSRTWGNESVIFSVQPGAREKEFHGQKYFILENVTEDFWELNGTKEGVGYRVSYNFDDLLLLLKWDRIIVDFDLNIESPKAGDNVKVTINAYYESNPEKHLNTADFSFLIYRDGQPFLNASGNELFFHYHELYPINHTYEMIYAHDSRTNLTGAFTVAFEPNPRITIKWNDLQPPRLIEQRIIDFGNGTIGFLVMVTDDQPEEYFGSGIQSVIVELKVQESPFGQWSKLNLTRYKDTLTFFGTINSSPDDPREYFHYGERIRYNISIIDFVENLETESFSKHLDYDSEIPRISPIMWNYSLEVDGNLNISFIASDNWSGLRKAIIRIFNENLNKWAEIKEMNRINQTSDSLQDIALYWINYNFTVGFTYKYEITVIDVSGKSYVDRGNILVIDKSAPRVESIKFEYRDFGQFFISLTVVDNGSLIDTVVLTYQIGENQTSISLARVVEGGGGSSFQENNYLDSQSFSKNFVIAPDLISSKTVLFSLIITDSEGNQRKIPHSEISQYLTGSKPNGFNIPSISTDIIYRIEFLFIIVIFVFSVAIVSVRRFRTISGFEKKKVLEELVKISENEVWQENDNISIGLFVNFFDQVKGPVPIIWFPDKPNISEKMRFSLADRSFSTLGFVSNASEEKDATFRYHFAGDNCMAFGYAFAIEKPEARGGQENLSICFLIRPPWGNLENLNKFRSELVEHFQQISELIKSDSDVKIIQQKMQNTRNFFTRAMLTFRRKYRQEFLE
ncbi:MAG: hypothetical protein ACFFCU_09690, partial [Promethearchaeota archaeon]